MKITNLGSKLDNMNIKTGLLVYCVFGFILITGAVFTLYGLVYIGQLIYQQTQPFLEDLFNLILGLLT